MAAGGGRSFPVEGGLSATIHLGHHRKQALSMSTSIIELYDRLRTAPDDEARARIIAEAFEALEERYPHLGETATRANLNETELRLIKEIEQMRADLSREIEQVRTDLKLEIAQVHSNLTLEIEKNRTEIEKVRADLTREIERVRADLKVDIARSHASLLKWSFLFWLTQFSAIGLLLWRLWPGG